MKKTLNIKFFPTKKSPYSSKKILQINIPSQNFVCWGSPSHLAYVTHFRCEVWRNPTFDNHPIRIAAKLLNSDTKKESSAPRTPQRNTNASSLGKCSSCVPQGLICGQNNPNVGLQKKTRYPRYSKLTYGWLEYLPFSIGNTSSIGNTFSDVSLPECSVLG